MGAGQTMIGLPANDTKKMATVKGIPSIFRQSLKSEEQDYTQMSVPGTVVLPPGTFTLST